MHAYVIVGVSLVVSLLTLFSMVKIWNGVFWGTAEQPMVPAVAPGTIVRAPRVMTAATVFLVGVTVAIAVLAGPIYELSVRAAEGLIDPTAYIDAVSRR